MCSWAGLTPGERTRDAHTRRGHITKQGSRWLRWMLVEAATTAVRDPGLGRFTGQMCPEQRAHTPGLPAQPRRSGRPTSLPDRICGEASTSHQ
ncbi:MAG: transposase [Actinomycetes bacterium]